MFWGGEVQDAGIWSGSQGFRKREREIYVRKHKLLQVVFRFPTGNMGGNESAMGRFQISRPNESGRGRFCYWEGSDLLPRILNPRCNRISARSPFHKSAGP